MRYKRTNTERLINRLVNEPDSSPFASDYLGRFPIQEGTTTWKVFKEWVGANGYDMGYKAFCTPFKSYFARPQLQRRGVSPERAIKGELSSPYRQYGSRRVQRCHPRDAVDGRNGLPQCYPGHLDAPDSV